MSKYSIFYSDIKTLSEGLKDVIKASGNGVADLFELVKTIAQLAKNNPKAVAKLRTNIETEYGKDAHNFSNTDILKALGDESINKYIKKFLSDIKIGAKAGKNYFKLKTAVIVFLTFIGFGVTGVGNLMKVLATPQGIAAISKNFAKNVAAFATLKTGIGTLRNTNNFIKDIKKLVNTIIKDPDYTILDDKENKKDKKQIENKKK